MSEKTCENCRHRDVPFQGQPCRGCGRDREFDRWEPREEPQARTQMVGCEDADGLLHIHPESETCEVCAQPERTEPWDAWKPGRDVDTRA